MFNNFKLGLFPFVSVLIGLGTGCAMSEDPVSEGQENTSIQAGQQPNGIRPEELLPDLAYELALRPLRYDKLLPETKKLLEKHTPEGARARKFLKYAFECAFSPNKQFEFYWEDSDRTVIEEVFVGRSGLAPEWHDAPLDETGQQWVSACLAARTNFYGKEVEISMRGSAPTLSGNDEGIGLSPGEEGAFWGNIFLSNPFLKSCYIETNVDYSRDEARECAAGHVKGESVVPCGMITMVGPCSEVCDLPTTHVYHTQCRFDSDAYTEQVITVFLY